jgi:hypothetical protein
MVLDAHLVLGEEYVELLKDPKTMKRLLELELELGSGTTATMRTMLVPACCHLS